MKKRKIVRDKWGRCRKLASLRRDRWSEWGAKRATGWRTWTPRPPLPGSSITPGAARTRTLTPIRTRTARLAARRRLTRTPIPTSIIILLLLRVIFLSTRQRQRQVSVSNSRWPRPPRTRPLTIPHLSSIICSCNRLRRRPCTSSISSTLLGGRSRREDLLTTEQVPNHNFTNWLLSLMGSVADRCVFRYYILEIRTLCIYCIFVFCIARKRERERESERGIFEVVFLDTVFNFVIWYIWCLSCTRVLCNRSGKNFFSRGSSTMIVSFHSVLQRAKLFLSCLTLELPK